MSCRENAMTGIYEEVTVLGKSMLFTDLRIDRATVPKGLYMYEVRYDDDNCGDPVQIANWVMVNHLGTLVSREPLKLVPSKAVNNAYLDIDPKKDWNYEGTSSTLAEYMEKHPPKKEKRQDFERRR